MLAHFLGCAYAAMVIDFKGSFNIQSQYKSNAIIIHTFLQIFREIGINLYSEDHVCGTVAAEIREDIYADKHKHLV